MTIRPTVKGHPKKLLVLEAVPAPVEGLVLEVARLPVVSPMAGRHQKARELRRHVRLP
ncbi:hypothetical protein [Rhizobium sp. FKY42]|uniref:hypothetical protein n=1 Tax=Rhizobium sp. FKY42 TaxID=2562310 RepID=UPI0019801B73|nr:hypothetical protein [Rhizobium sp. FKY42]